MIDVTADDAVRVSLAMRVPKTLSRQLKLYCVERDLSLMDVIASAVREKLASAEHGPRKRATVASVLPRARGARIHRVTAAPRGK